MLPEDMLTTSDGITEVGVSSPDVPPTPHFNTL